MGHCRKELISFFLTNQCNMDCCYCSVGRKPDKKKTLDVKFAKIALDDYFRTYSRAKGVRFFANGEPTLEMGIMKEITDYAKAKYGDIEVEVQTNGYFNKSACDWLKENATIVWISFDGLPEYHDKYRTDYGGKGTSGRIINNIKELTKHIKVGCRMTITNETVGLQKEALRFFNSIGIKYICSDPIYDVVEQGNHEVPDKPDYMRYVDEYIDALETAKELNQCYLSFLNVNFDEEVTVHCRACLPTPHVLNDGYVSCCDMAYSFSPVQMRPLIYGHYKEDDELILYDEEVIKRIKDRNTYNLENCKDCEVLLHCAGGCIGESLNETGEFNGIRTHFCEAVKYLAKRIGIMNTGIYPFTHP